MELSDAFCAQAMDAGAEIAFASVESLLRNPDGIVLQYALLCVLTGETADAEPKLFPLQADFLHLMPGVLCPGRQPLRQKVGIALCPEAG
jgi:hypothetical protein